MVLVMLCIGEFQLCFQCLNTCYRAFGDGKFVLKFHSTFLILRVYYLMTQWIMSIGPQLNYEIKHPSVKIVLRLCLPQISTLGLGR